MADFITLTCPTCGGKLDITKDIERFACVHCGNEHVVNRGGGIVSISPVVEAIKKVEGGVDRTAAELAISRLKKEIDSIKKERLEYKENHKEPSGAGCGISFALLGILFLVFWIVSKDKNAIMFVTSLFGIGLGVLIYYLGKKELDEWKKSYPIGLKKIDERLHKKNNELDRNKRIVSDIDKV